MIGWKPAVTFAAGFRIDSRRYASSTDDRLAALQRHGLAEQALEHRPAALRVGPMAGVAREVVRTASAPADASDPSGAPPLSHA